jgi:hypothetical protein
MMEDPISQPQGAETEGTPTSPEKPNWNELQFLSWGEFKQMAPSILQLEVTRLGKLMQTFPGGTDFHNSLVRTRFALRRFIACIEHAEKDTVGDKCGEHLRAAIMNLSLQPEELDGESRETCSYILDRLNYTLQRIRLIY